MLAAPNNLAELEDALFDSAARATHAMHKGKQLPPMTLDIDSFPHKATAISPAPSTTATTRCAASTRLA